MKNENEKHSREIPEICYISHYIAATMQSMYFLPLEITDFLSLHQIKLRDKIIARSEWLMAFYPHFTKITFSYSESYEVTTFKFYFRKTQL